MDTETITLIWLVAGILMMGSEILVPGMVIGFLGLASVIVAGIRSLGLVESLEASLGLWATISVALMKVCRTVPKSDGSGHQLAAGCSRWLQARYLLEG